MIGTLRKHSKWLWSIIITVVIVTFVIFFSPNVGMDRGGGEVSYGTLYGEPIKREDLAQAYADARLGFFFMSGGRWPTEQNAMMAGFNLDSEARRRLLLNRLVKEHGIDVGDAVVAAQIKVMFADQKTGGFNLQGYDDLLKRTFAPAGVKEDDFERFLKRELSQQQLAQMFSVSGKLITARAADGFYRRENEQALTEFVFLASSNNLPKVKLDEAALRAYHTNNLTTYRIAERVVVNYVYFPYTNYNAEAEKELAATTNLNTLLESYYKTNVFRYRDTNGTAKTFEQARGEIRNEFRDDAARQHGFRKAGEFANELFGKEGKDATRATNLFALAAAKGLPVKVTEPFTQFEGPKLTNAPGNFGHAAFQLTTEEALGQMMPGSDGVYFIAFKERLKPEDPPYEKVREKVVEDYKRFQAKELTLEEGTKLVQAANDGLAKGKSFKDTAKALGHVALEVPPFSRNTRSIEIAESRGLGVDEFRDQAFATAAGKVGSFKQAGEGGFVIYVRGFQPVTDVQVKAELPKFVESLREQRANYAFREWLSREVERSGVMASAQQQSKKRAGQPSEE